MTESSGLANLKISNYIPNPTVIYETSRGQTITADLYSRLLKENIIFIGTPIDDTVAPIWVIASMTAIRRKSRRSRNRVCGANTNRSTTGRNATHQQATIKSGSIK